jgi:serine-type D-Ala-D-Ala carboxypeptidase/endopeptidase (penicillin-binding protein 4)
MTTLLRPALLACLLAALPAFAQLPAPVTAQLAATNIAEDAMGVLVLRGDQVVLSHLPDRPLQPASTMKLVTTLIGLEQLGPVFKGRTEMRSSGEVRKDVLRGDLVLRGGADADLDSAAIERMLRALRNQGIKRISGRLVLDRGLFNPVRTDIGVPPFDESPDAYYNVIPDALLVNKNMLQLDLRSEGDTLRIAVEPVLDKLAIESNMTLIDGPCPQWEDGWKLPEVVSEAGGKLKVVLQGTFPRNCVASNSINIVDRQDYVDRVVRTAWRKLGGRIDGATVDGPTPADAKLLAAHVSRALPEVVRDINKPSDNALARTVYLSLGSLEADSALGSHPIAGAAREDTSIRADLAVRSWMRAHGIDDTGLVMENGSGLSRLERISPRQMALLLHAGLRSPWAPEFMASMPIVGMDGTMRNRLKDSPATGRARMKTGTLKNVVALAGYVPDATGQMCIVVAMINSDNTKDGKGRIVLDALTDWVARSGTQ